MVTPILACIAITALSARSEDPPITLAVVTADGKPSAGAKVWVYPYTGKEQPAAPMPLATDVAGKLTLPFKAGARRSSQLFARDSAGRIGWSWTELPLDDDGARTVKVVLIDTANRSGRVLTSDGKPVAGAVVAPLSYSALNEARREPGGPATSISLPEWEQTRLTVKTDVDGRFTLVAASGYSVFYRVTADGFGETRWMATPDVKLDVKIARPGSVAISVTGVDPAVLKGTEWRLGAPDGPREKSPGVRAVRSQHGTFDGKAKLIIPAVVPGRYELHIWNSARVPAVFQKGEPLVVEPGLEAAIYAKFGPAATVTGRVVDKETGKGIGGVRVNVNVSDVNSTYPREQLSANTDKDGHYTIHGSAGWFMAWIHTPPEGYATPRPPGRSRSIEPVQVEAGKTRTLTAIELPKAITMTGQVNFADGQPAGKATLLIHNDVVRGNGELVADKDGNFAIKNLPPDDAVAPRVRLGKAVNIPETFDLEKVTQTISIAISEANAAGFKGQVIDVKGQPLAGARVKLRHHILLVGRMASYGTIRPLASTTSDANGHYSFEGLWPRDGYSVQITAAGYAPGEAKQLIGDAGVVKTFATVRLARASLAVAGTVVGSDGRPVAGSEVFGIDGPARFSTTSAADGSFTLSGYFEGTAYVFVRKPGYRFAAVQVTPGNKKRVTLALTKTSEPPTAQPEITAEHRAALERFTRHALTLVWDSHAKFGYGGNALEDMARIDPDTAKKWRDAEKARSGGKTDFTRLMDRAVRAKTLFDTAKTDVDEALAVIQSLKAEDGFSEAIRIGERMLAVDKATAARLAEEAVVRARQLGIPNKLWSLAAAGNLAARAGNTVGGKKVMVEAAELAEKLTLEANSLNSLAVGLVAANLAPYDWPKAETLLNLVKDPGEYNRYLSAAVARLARTDLAKTKQLLDRFKPSNSSEPQTGRLRVAFAIAKEKPDEAIKLINSVREGPYRVQGYIQLAVILAPTHKLRANKLIDTAFDDMERNAEAFRSWSNFGGRAALAAIGAVRAKEIGYPDVAQLVARTLAMRAPAQDLWSLRERENNVVNLAAVLACIDPATARNLLATIAPVDEFIEKAVSQQRDWLFALALADPDRATKLADKLIERAKNARGGRNPLSNTGLVELGSILTAADRLKMLTQYGSLPREIDDHD